MIAWIKRLFCRHEWRDMSHQQHGDQMFLRCTKCAKYGWRWLTDEEWDEREYPHWHRSSPADTAVYGTSVVRVEWDEAFDREYPHPWKKT